MPFLLLFHALNGYFYQIIYFLQRKYSINTAKWHRGETDELQKENAAWFSYRRAQFFFFLEIMKQLTSGQLFFMCGASGTKKKIQFCEVLSHVSAKFLFVCRIFMSFLTSIKKSFRKIHCSTLVPCSTYIYIYIKCEDMCMCFKHVLLKTLNF